MLSPDGSETSPEAGGTTAAGKETLRFQPEHIVDAVLHEAMLHIRLQGHRLAETHTQQPQGPEAIPVAATCKRQRSRLRWGQRGWGQRNMPVEVVPNAGLAPVWRVADLLHNSVGYLTHTELASHGWPPPGIEALQHMCDLVPFAPRTDDDRHLLAWLQRALRGTGWTLDDLHEFARTTRA